MKKIRVLQIGDVHFPDVPAHQLADVKDAGFPASLLGTMRPSPLTYVARALTAELESKPDAIIFCGDLTSRGEITGYRDCLKYLSSLLNLSSWDATRIHAVPGNHDVDREAIDKAGVDLYQKFENLRQAWEAIGLPVLAVDNCRSTVVRQSKSVCAQIFSINSSLGCGEKRHLPEKVQSQLFSILTDLVSTAGLEAAFETVGEALDTPSFDFAQIDDICRIISAADKKIMPVVVTHHNLLPQSFLRVELYTEAINSGAVRSRFTKLSRPLLYCHGHIHENPVEVVRQAPLSHSALICVSAPELSRGYNIIDIEFGKAGYPLGCRVRQRLLNPLDCELKETEHKISFYAPTQVGLGTVGHPSLPNVLANMTDAKVRFSTLAEKLKIKAADLKQALLEAEWLGFVELDNQEYDVEHWQITRLVR